MAIFSTGKKVSTYHKARCIECLYKVFVELKKYKHEQYHSE